MKTYGTFEQDGIHADLGYTVMEDIRRLAFMERMVLSDVLRVQTWQLLFVGVAAMTRRVTGVDWSPPELDADGEALEQSFRQLAGQVSPQTLVAWNNAIVTLTRSTAPPEEQRSGDENEDFLASAPMTSENTSTQ